MRNEKMPRGDIIAGACSKSMVVMAKRVTDFAEPRQNAHVNPWEEDVIAVVCWVVATVSHGLTWMCLLFGLFFVSSIVNQRAPRGP